MSRIRVGLSGYSYREWQGEGKLYPPKLRQSDFLRFYAERYEALEMVGVFAYLPTEKTVAKWIADTPDDFRACPKMHQSVTHYQRLKPESLEGVEQLAKALEPVQRVGKLGPVLIQLPPNLKRNDYLLDAFLARLPGGFEWAVEFRHESWNSPVTEALLRAHRTAWVAADTDEEDAKCADTADFHYVRLRKSEYDDAALTEWATYLKDTGKPAYVFCRHTDIPAPWLWADRLNERLRSTEPDLGHSA